MGKTKNTGYGRSYGYIKPVKTKKIPIELEFKTKDGKIVIIKATKIVRDSSKP